MPGHSIRAGETRGASEELSKREERAHRILDAAAELIQRWGYKKTAVDDIARLAGVAKGTIYLHWKTREDLFMALLLRESMEAVQAMATQIDRDPSSFCLSNVIKNSIYVIMVRPLSRALFIRDVSVLGELLQQGRADLEAISQQKLLTGQQLLSFFRSKGALRTDQSLEEQLKIYATLIIGTLTIDQYMPAELLSSPEEAAQRLAMMLHATLEPADPLPPAIQHELKATWDRIFEEFKTMLDARLRKEMA